MDEEAFERSPVFEAVRLDLEARDHLGWKRHGGPLLTGSDARDWLTEAYEEALDLVVYLRAALLCRDGR